jgi:hypothetical protein
LRQWLVFFVVVIVLVTCTRRGGGRMIGGGSKDRQPLAGDCIVIANCGRRAAKKKGVIFVSWTKLKV